MDENHGGDAQEVGDASRPALVIDPMEIQGVTEQAIAGEIERG